ncbi:MAG: hypothetical protein ABIU05_11600, partial [Nitrospirales bacterium]
DAFVRRSYRRAIFGSSVVAQTQPTLAAIYCAVGPEWITKVIQSGSSRWKPQHYQFMKKQKPKLPYLLKAT